MLDSVLAILIYATRLMQLRMHSFSIWPFLSLTAAHTFNNYNNNCSSNDNGLFTAPKCIIYIPYCSSSHSGLPLNYDIEGPASQNGNIFVLGARPITSGYDLNFNGQLAAVTLFPSRAPPQFSLCVLDCLESLIVDTQGTAIDSLPFNAVDRVLVLNGPAPPSDFEQVLRNLAYLNRAPDINLNTITMEVSFCCVY